MTMIRRMLLQREVIEIIEILGLKTKRRKTPFDRSTLLYYIKMGIFPKPFSTMENNIVWYKIADVYKGIKAIAACPNINKEVTKSEINMALAVVLHKNSMINNELININEYLNQNK